MINKEPFTLLVGLNGTGSDLIKLDEIHRNIVVSGHDKVIIGAPLKQSSPNALEKVVDFLPFSKLGLIPKSIGNATTRSLTNSVVPYFETDPIKERKKKQEFYLSEILNRKNRKAQFRNRF